MSKKKEARQSDELAKEIISGMQDKKGQKIALIDLRNISNSISDYFVVCHGSSTTNVDAIAHSVEEKTREHLGEKPKHREGRREAEWIVLDYFDVVAHIFLEEKRTHFNIEDLWADAEVDYISEE